MRKLLLAALMVVLTLVSVLAGWLVWCWFDAQNAISVSEGAGYLDTRTSDVALSRNEAVFAFAEFEYGWGQRAQPCRMVRNSWNFITNQSERPARGPAGQLALNLPANYTHERSFLRSGIISAFVECQLEQHYSDRQLLRNMRRHVYFGDGLFGLDAAAHADFGEPPDQLNQDQVAHLAVLLRNPAAMRENPDRWNERARALEARIQSAGSLPR